MKLQIQVRAIAMKFSSLVGNQYNYGLPHCWALSIPIEQELYIITLIFLAELFLFP